MVLTSGLMAMRTGYLNSRVRSSTPLERAVITYCLRSSSSIVPRMMRISPPVPAVPTTTIGTGRWVIRSHSFARLNGSVTISGENRPPIVTPNQTLNKYIRIRASRKLGVASPMKPMVVTV